MSSENENIIKSVLAKSNAKMIPLNPALQPRQTHHIPLRSLGFKKRLEVSIFELLPHGLVARIQRSHR